MNAQQLRNSILQEAIEGRLVPHNPNDEPASALLERIREEKRRLVKEGKLKKKDLVETPISEDEIPFDIPESWEWARLGSLLKFISDGTHKTPNYVTSGIPFLSVQNISSGKLTMDKIKYITEEEHNVLIKRVKPTKGDILICRIGTLGKALKIYWDFEFSIFVSLGLLRPVDEKLTDYLVFCINSPLGFNWIQKNKVGGGTHTFKINLGDMPNMLIPIPPLSEQKRIVAKIEELMPKVEEYGKAQEALDKLNEELPEKLKKSILQEAIEGRLVQQDPNDEPASVLLQRIREEKKRLVKEGKLKKKDLVETPISEDEIPFEIPESWEWCRIGTIASVLGGKRIPAGRKLSQENTGHIYIRVSDMKEDTVSTDNLLYVPEDIYPSISKYIINKDDVYITVAGTIGRIGKIPPELDGANLTENADRIVFTNINQDWLIKCLQSNFVQKQITDVTTKVGQPKLAILRIQNLLIPLPPLAEQKRIVEKIEQLMGEIDKLKV